MTAEIQTIWFDPSEIQAALDRNLPEGLRMLADAIERRYVDGKLLDANGVGGGRNDDRAHVLVRLDIAAPVMVMRAVAAPLELGCEGE